VRNLIRENKIPQIASMMQMGSRYGMQTMEDSVKALVNQGLVDPSEMDRFVPPSDAKAQAGMAPQPQAAAPAPQAAPPPPPPPEAPPPPETEQPKPQNSLFKRNGVSSLLK
jgi:twitching motility protein PilT